MVKTATLPEPQENSGMDVAEYWAALEKRDKLEIELEKAYDAAHILQKEYNDLDDKITDYEDEQHALDW